MIRIVSVAIALLALALVAAAPTPAGRRSSSRPGTYNTDSATAVSVVNAATAGSGPSGWTCDDNSSTVADGGYCNMPSGMTYMVVQWNDNVEAP